MSCYYDLECVEHGDQAGFHWNRGARELRHIWMNRGVCFDFLQLDPERFHLDLDLAFESRWCGAEWGPSLVDFSKFIQAHHGCTVKPKDEYGRWYDQCAEYVECTDCGRRDNCALAENHDGPCQRSEP